MGEPAEAPKVEEGGQVLLFDKKFEGVKITDYRLNFGGNVELGDPELIKALALDEEVTLIVKGRVVSRSHKTKTAKDAKSTAVSSSAIVVETVTLEA